MKYIYIHTCPNGKKYVGTTQRKPEKRWENGNGYKRNEHFYSAIQKYGWENIQHQVIEVDTNEDMWYGEKYLIAYFNTTDREFGYNNSTGGEIGNFGCHYKINGHPQSDETRKKISSSLKGRKTKGHVAWNKGIKCPNISASKKGKERPKQKWMTPNGEIVFMNISHVKQHHIDWISVE